MSQSAEIANALRLRLMRGSHLGTIKAGARLPSVRDLSGEFAVDHRTILAAYHTLEREGLVRMRPRSGIYFDPSTSTRERADLSRSARWVLDVLLVGLARGISVAEMPAELAKYSRSMAFRVACVECNDDQAAALQWELESDLGVDAVAFNVDQLLCDTHAAVTMKKFDLIVTTPFHAGQVQRLAEQANVPWVAITYRADLFADIARQLPSTPVHFVLTDERYAAKLSRIFAASAGAAQLHLLKLGCDDIDSIPEGQPTYLSFKARRQLAGGSIVERAVPETRACSLESTREILTFLVNANAAVTGDARR